MSDNNKTFVRVTNQKIYDKLEIMHDIIMTLEIRVKETNGRVTKLEKARTTIMSAFGTGFLFIIGWLLTITIS